MKLLIKYQNTEYGELDTNHYEYCYLRLLSRMNKKLQTIAAFVTSSRCIFSLKKIDYPSLLQQKMITSYFQYTKIIDQQYDQIIRVLHTANDRTLQSIVIGVLYCILLNPENPEQFLQHLKTLKNEAWNILANIFQQILVETFEDIKPECRIGIGIVYSQLFCFHSVNDGISIMLVKTVDCFDMSENGLTYAGYIFQVVQDIAEKYQSAPSQNAKVLCKFMLFKLLRFFINISFIEDSAVSELKQTCKELIFLIWRNQKQECQAFGHEMSRILQEFYKLQQMSDFTAEARSLIEDSKTKSNWNLREVAISTLLPIQVETSLIFICKEKISRQAIWIELNWLWKQQYKKGDNVFFMLVEMVRWMAIASANVEEKVYIIEWVVHRASEKPLIFEMIKQALFLDWLEDDCPFHVLLTSLHFLGYTMSKDINIGEEMLSYVLSHKSQSNPEFTHKVKEILVEANKQGILKIEHFMETDVISIKIKTELKEIFESTHHTTLEYDPSESAEDIEYQDYASSDHDHPHLKRRESIDSPSKDEIREVYRVNFQSQFVEDLEDSLTEVLDNPTPENYEQFMDKVLSVCIGYKKQNEHGLLNMMIKETAKTLYLMYNPQFQDFQAKSMPKGVILSFLNVIIADWRINSFKSQIYKKIIRCMFELFPITQFAFWKGFLENFRRGTVNHKEVFDWLISKEKHAFVLPALERFMGSNIHSLVEHAASYSLPVRK